MPLLAPMLRMKTNYHPLDGYLSLVDVLKRHSTTSLSTIEAELMVATETFAQATHLWVSLEDVETAQWRVKTIYIDSRAACQESIGEGYSKHLNHVNVALQWLIEMIMSITMALKLIRTSERAADYPTKALQQDQHEICCRAVGLRLTISRKVEEEDGKSKRHGGMLENIG